MRHYIFEYGVLLLSACQPVIQPVSLAYPYLCISM